MRRFLLVSMAVALAVPTATLGQQRVDSIGLPVMPPAFGLAPQAKPPAAAPKSSVTDAEVEADLRRKQEMRRTALERLAAQDELVRLKNKVLEDKERARALETRSLYGNMMENTIRISVLQYLPEFVAMFGAVMLLALLVLAVKLFSAKTRYRSREGQGMERDIGPRQRSYPERTPADLERADDDLHSHANRYRWHQHSPMEMADCRFSKKPLLSPWERVVLSELRIALPAGWYVCPQVRVADMLDITARDERSHRSALGHVKSRSVDFVLIDDDAWPRLVIELDDKSHRRADRRRRDAILDAVYAEARLPVEHIRPGRSPDWAALIANVAHVVAPEPEPEPDPGPEPRSKDAPVLRAVRTW